MRNVLRAMTITATASLVAAGLWLGTGGAAHAAPKWPGLAGSDRGHGHGMLLAAPLSPSVPTDRPIFGVNPGAKPWSLTHGKVRLTADGSLQANVQGLVLTTTGTNPIPDLAAAVYCNGVLAATTAPAPLSSRGDSRIRSRLTLPSFCPAPAVLLKPATGSLPSDVNNGVYIAFDGAS